MITMKCGWCKGEPTCKKVQGGFICPSCNKAYGDPLKDTQVVATNISVSDNKIQRNFNCGEYVGKKKAVIPEHILLWLQEELKKNIKDPKTGQTLNPFDPRWTCKKGQWVFSGDSVGDIKSGKTNSKK